MTARVMVHCDAVHADRVPPACRAFLVTSTVHEGPAYEEAEAAGWTQEPGNVDYCPSCSRGRQESECTCGYPGLTYDGPHVDCPVHGRDTGCTGCGREVTRPGLCHDCDVQASYVGGLAPTIGAQP